MTAKQCTKKRDARAKLMFCYYKLIAFWPFLLPSPSPSHKLPIKDDSDGNLNHKRLMSLCICIRHTCDTFRPVTRYIDYYVVHIVHKTSLFRESYGGR